MAGTTKVEDTRIDREAIYGGDLVVANVNLRQWDHTVTCLQVLRDHRRWSIEFVVLLCVHRNRYRFNSLMALHTYHDLQKSVDNNREGREIVNIVRDDSMFVRDDFVRVDVNFHGSRGCQRSSRSTE